MNTEKKFVLVHPRVRGEDGKSAILAAFPIWPEDEIGERAIDALRKFYETNFGPKLSGLAFRFEGDAHPFLNHIF